MNYTFTQRIGSLKKIEEEINKMDLINFDFTKLLNSEGPYPWMVRDHIKDFTMI